MLRTAVFNTTHHNNKLGTSNDQHARMRPRMVANMFHPTIYIQRDPVGGGNVTPRTFMGI